MAIRDKKPGFDSELVGKTLRIKLRGEIDHHSAVAVRSSIDDMIKRKKPQELVIDMSAVDFMDSSGLGLIMGRYAVIKELGGTFYVADPSPRIEKIMRLAGMERIVPIRHTVARTAESVAKKSSGGTSTGSMRTKVRKSGKRVRTAESTSILSVSNSTDTVGVSEQKREET